MDLLAQDLDDLVAIMPYITYLTDSLEQLGPQVERLYAVRNDAVEGRWGSRAGLTLRNGS